jgi:hypothetical protein
VFAVSPTPVLILILAELTPEAVTGAGRAEERPTTAE